MPQPAAASLPPAGNHASACRRQSATSWQPCLSLPPPVCHQLATMPQPAAASLPPAGNQASACRRQSAPSPSSPHLLFPPAASWLHASACRRQSATGWQPCLSLPPPVCHQLQAMPPACPRDLPQRQRSACAAKSAAAGNQY
ncbi:hypothetical protein CYMTET_35815 [Cymbomonas tetramitiformis]|uniref:Uncharacterized protein n=1 Tax=Cymbomonas tetramitiformis TaxID=36881 RepID=A0AAE0KNC8_9CHLO|nr:hypothetical protein CYMTET_35815 [Cymbomonas tetramitiformis]